MEKETSPIKLIVGLGNPGPQYSLTRHNIGFLYLNFLPMIYAEFPSWQQKFQGLFTKGTIAQEDVKLLQPQTFMNLSGQSVAACCQFFKIEPQDVLVIHDDSDLEFLKIRVKQGGGNAGHNGLKSIEQHIGNNFWRLRLGIGRPARGDLADYVLSAFSKDEQEELSDFLPILGNHFPLLLQKKADDFASQCTQELHPRSKE
jgi:peptidyl-tRNA hydrolase, PTH1 family